MRICFTSDLHGDDGLYEQLANLLRAETPDLLILGGDMLRDGERDDPLGTQVVYFERRHMARVAAWKAANPRLTVACIPGNHTWTCTRDAMQAQHDAGRLVLLNHKQVWHHGGFAFLGYADTPACPFWIKDFERLDLPGDPIPEFEGSVWDPVEQRPRAVNLAEHFTSQPTMAEELAQAPPVPDPWILVAHTPPHDSKLDRLPNVAYPIGSRAVRRFIEQRQPLCSLHGHVHDSALVTGGFADRIGRTLCINPGQGHERLHAVVFDTERPGETLRHTVYP